MLILDDFRKNTQMADTYLLAFNQTTLLTIAQNYSTKFVSI